MSLLLSSVDSTMWWEFIRRGRRRGKSCFVQYRDPKSNRGDAGRRRTRHSAIRRSLRLHQVRRDELSNGDNGVQGKHNIYYNILKFLF